MGLLDTIESMAGGNMGGQNGTNAQVAGGLMQALEADALITAVCISQTY